MARENGWACATNDAKLRKECLKAGIEVIRGLKLLLILVEERRSTKKKAKNVAESTESIFSINRQITEDILEEFLNELAKL
ncbi:unnamed protein product [marine sediment metagenome]|uniref:Uncharacterized protein n=1 Tax=marine sediment metagenome TaxID=412755 RepID=X1KHC3_9ZZZZ